MIFKGTIFFSLRSKVLDFYPEKCQTNKRERVSFTEWLQKGIYNIVLINNTEIIIESSPQEIGSILLSDIEYLCNMCFEHLQESLCFNLDERIRSDAWNIVSIYYFGFFVTQALLRLIGRPVLFINKEAIQFLKRGTKSLQNPGSGTYLLEKLKDLSGTTSEYRLKYYKNKIHEASWKQLFNILEGEINNNKLTAELGEILFYKAITTKKLFRIYNNYEWPSRIRNKANYRPGYAYRLIENIIEGKSKRLIIRWLNCNEQVIMDNLNSSINLCIASTDNDLPGHVSLLHDISQSLFIIFRELYFELLNRRHLDLRMELKRKDFVKKMTLSKDHKCPLVRSL